MVLYFKFWWEEEQENSLLLTHYRITFVTFGPFLTFYPILCRWLMCTGMELINGQKHSAENLQTIMRIFLWLMIRQINLNQTKPRTNGCRLRKATGANMESVGNVSKINMGCAIAIKNELR